MSVEPAMQIGPYPTLWGQRNASEGDLEETWPGVKEMQ